MARKAKKAVKKTSVRGRSASVARSTTAEFIPISPMRKKNGALIALASRLGDAGATPPPLANVSTALNNFHVFAGGISMSLASSLSLGSIFKGSVSASDKAFYLDAFAYTDQYDEHGPPNAPILATRWGVGIRVFLKATDVTSNLSLSFATVGAAVELSLANATYEIEGIGIGADGLADVLKQIKPDGKFDYDTFLAINGAVSQDLATYIQQNKATLTPEPVAVLLERPIDPSAEARSHYYAMRRISDRKSLNDAIAAAAIDIDRDILRGAYYSIAAVKSDTEQPSRTAGQTADAWLKV